MCGETIARALERAADTKACLIGDGVLGETVRLFKELFAGVLVFDSQQLFRLLPQLHNANVQQEYYLTEIPEMMAREGLLVETFPTDDANDLRGINTPEDVEICRDILRQRQRH